MYTHIELYRVDDRAKWRTYWARHTYARAYKVAMVQAIEERYPSCEKIFEQQSSIFYFVLKKTSFQNGKNLVSSTLNIFDILNNKEKFEYMVSTNMYMCTL